MQCALMHPAVFLKLDETTFNRLNPVDQLDKLASSGPYGPFLAIQRAFIIRYIEKMSAGKCIVGKRLVGKCLCALNGWTE